MFDILLQLTNSLELRTLLEGFGKTPMHNPKQKNHASGEPRTQIWDLAIWPTGQATHVVWETS